MTANDVDIAGEISGDSCHELQRIHKAIERIRAVGVHEGPDLRSSIAILCEQGSIIRQIVGDELVKALDRFQGSRVGDLAAKRDVAKALNYLFDTMGLRMICPHSGLPAWIEGATRSDGRGDGRFQLHISGRRTPSLSSSTLPQIRVVLLEPSKSLSPFLRSNSTNTGLSR